MDFLLGGRLTQTIQEQGNSGSLPGNTAECPWKYSTVGSWGYWNTNQGQSTAPAINSTTSFNGFLISDIDSEITGT